MLSNVSTSTRKAFYDGVVEVAETTIIIEDGSRMRTVHYQDTGNVVFVVTDASNGHTTWITLTRDEVRALIKGIL